MASVRYHIRINRSSDDVWKLVSDAAAISEWFPGIVTSSVDGSTRLVNMGEGLDLVEEIVTNDDELRRFQYRITGGVMPVEHHLGTVDVIEDGHGALVIYGTDVRPDELAGMVGPATEGGLEGLKKKLES